MSVAEPALAENFTARIVKTLTTNPGVKWQNSYKFRVRAAATTDDLKDAVNIMAAFESELMDESVRFLNGLVSTAIPDSEPYQRKNFAPVDLGVTFGQNAFANPQPLEMVVYVQKLVETGNPGRIFYRRMLDEGHVISPSGFPQEAVPNTLNTAIAAARSSSGLNALLTGGGHPLELIIGGGVDFARVQGVEFQAISFKQLNNKYFDVPPS